MKLKTILRFLLVILIIQTFTFSAFCTNIDEYYEDRLEASGADELADSLSEETREYLENLGFEELNFEKILEVSPKAVFSLLLDAVKGGYKKPLKAGLSAVGVILLVSVCSAFFPDDEKSKAVLNLICGCVVVLDIFTSAAGSIKAGVSAIEACAVFEKALIPVLAGILTAGGNPSLALSFKGAAFAAAEFVQAFSSNFALPLIGISGALGIAGAMWPALRLNAVSDIIRKTMTTALACVSGLFTGFLSLKSVLASSADGMIVKGVKMASSFVPVVGGALGEAYTSVAAGLSLLKSTVGIYAIAAFSAICLPVVIDLALWVLAMRIACAVSDLLDCRVCSEILKNTAFVFSTANALLLFSAAVFIISSGLVITVGRSG